MEAGQRGGPNGDASLAVTVRAARDGAGALWITVADNGPGFEGPGEALFADGVTTRTRGSGLGLGAARRAVSAVRAALRTFRLGFGDDVPASSIDPEAAAVRPGQVW